MTRVMAGLVLGLTASTLVAAPAHADHERLPAGRTAVPYVVEPGDTASGLASRFHAWTAELISYNHLDTSGSLQVGQRIVIPVVREGARGGDTDRGTTMWQHPDGEPRGGPPRDRRAARSHGVDPQLALAVSWQESGWQMGVVSGAHAIGAMQVLPSTGRWMEDYAGRPLHLRTLEDNATAGVMLLRVLAATRIVVRTRSAPTTKASGRCGGTGSTRRRGRTSPTSRRSCGVSRPAARRPERLAGARTRADVDLSPRWRPS